MLSVPDDRNYNVMIHAWLDQQYLGSYGLHTVFTSMDDASILE
jgi:hypothetical protein